MNWPLPQDFNEAVQNPGTAFTDPDLKAGQAVVGPQGLPLPRSGNFADVYQIRTPEGRDWAVKCFTRPVTGLEHRYAKVDAALAQAGFPFTIGFTFLNEGVRARGQWLPAVKMEWVDGLLLNQVVRDQAGSPKVLDALGQMWARLCKRLREAGIAHADLQHGNVLLVPGSRPGTYGLKLIDYDGMYVPALANNPSGEAGHPNYQHPVRATKQVYSPDLDRFPHLVIATALKGLAVLGASLWQRYDTGDNLLFTDEDFRSPAESRLMRELWQANNPGLRALVGHLAVACGRPIPQTPWLDQVAPDGVVEPLSPEQERAATVALGLAPPAPVVAVNETLQPGEGLGQVPPPVSQPALVFELTEDLPPFEVECEVGPGRQKPQQRSSVPPLLIVGGIFLLLSAIAGAVVGGIVLLGGKNQDETAQTHPKPDGPTEIDQKPKEKPKPEKEKEPRPEGGPKPPVIPVVPSASAGPVDVASLPHLPVRWEKTTGHGGGISRMAFTADGRLLAVAGYGRKDVRVLDAKSGISTGGFTEHETPVLGLASLPGGEIASLGADQAFALVWEPGTGRGKGKILCPELPQRTPEPFVYTSPDGRYLMCGGTESDNGQPAAVPPSPIEVTDADTGKSVVSFRMSWGVARFTSDSTRLVVADDRTGLMRVFRFPSRQPVSEANADNGPQSGLAVAVSPDGRFAVYLGKADLPGGRGFNVHEVATGRRVRTIPILPTASFRSGFSPDGKWFRLVHTAPGGAEVVLVDTTTWIPQAVAAVGNTQGVQWDHGPQFSPDGKFLAVPKAGGRVVAFELPRDGVVLGAPKPKDPGPDQSPLPVVEAPAEAKVRWVSTTSAKAGWGYAAFTTDSQAVVVGSTTRGGIKGFLTLTGTPLVPVLESKEAIFGVMRLARGRIGVYSPDDKAVFAWDPRTPRGVAQIPAPDLKRRGNVPVIRMSPNERFLAIGYHPIISPKDPTDPKKGVNLSPGEFEVYDTTTGKAVVATTWSNDVVFFTADSSRLLVAEASGRVRWFSLPSGELEGEWSYRTARPEALALHFAGMSGDGRFVLVEEYGPRPPRQKGLYLVDGKTGDEVRRVGEAYAYNSPVVMTPDGLTAVRLVVEKPADGGTIEVIDLARGVVLGRLKVPGNADTRYSGFDVSPDGRAVALHDVGQGLVSVVELPDNLVAIAPKPKDPEPKPKDPEPKPKDPEPKPKDPKKDPAPKPAPKPIDRKPVPDDAAVTKAETQVREKLKDDYAKKSTAEKKAFAAKLIGLAEKQADDPAARYVMLRDARVLAVEAADAVVAAEAVDGLARRYEVEGGRLKHAALETIREAATTAATLRAVAEVALAGADTAFAADDYEAAAKLAQTAAEAARRANLSAAIVDEAEAEAARAKKAGSAFGEVRHALDRLKANPDDADAALTVGKYQCFTQGRWEEGLKWLTKGGGALKAVAELDANTPRDGSPDAKVGDAWWDYAQTAPDAEKRAAEIRARHWYALALPKLTGDQKTQAETRLALTYNGVDYRPGLVAEFSAKVPSVLQGKKGRVDPVVVFSGGEFSDAGVGRATDISVKWTGAIVPPGPGRYKLVANTTDPVRVRVDGKAVIDTISSKTGKREGTIGLPDRPCPVTIEFPCINTDRHQLKLCWARAGSDAEDLIPPEVLFHDRKAETAIGK